MQRTLRLRPCLPHLQACQGVNLLAVGDERRPFAGGAGCKASTRTSRAAASLSTSQVLGSMRSLYTINTQIRCFLMVPLVAPSCAIPRDYLSDTSLLRVMGFFGVSTWPIGCDTPSLFLSVSPLQSMRSGGSIPP